MAPAHYYALGAMMTETEKSADGASIRSALRLWLINDVTGHRDALLIDELALCRGSVRADLAVVNGLLHGYEIKSDRDSLRRLAGQADVYSQVFERMTLVVGDRYAHSAAAVVPDWWGLVRVSRSRDGVLEFDELRAAEQNPGLNPRALVELLWSAQALALLESRKAARGVKGKPRRVLWDRICREFGIEEIAEAVRDGLKAREASQSPA